MHSAIIKSQNDKNLYKAIELENGMKVLLISDQTNVTDENAKLDNIEVDDVHNESGLEPDDDAPISEDGSFEDVNPKKKVKMAAAAMCVSAGSFSDPEDVPGLAHFVEHMIFMGSEKYPDENAYDSYLSAHGGSSNANTDTEYTLFYFNVVPNYFKKALDIFANCFVSPIFNPDAVDREIEAVDSEFSNAAPDDGERLNLILQTTTKPNHPMGKFMWGNRKTLKDIPLEKNYDINAAVRNFYNKFYSAQYMTLALQSTDSIEVLEEWVREIFSVIPNRNLPLPNFEHLTEPYELEKFHKLYKIIPIKNVHVIHLTWSMPPSLKYYRSKPIRYIETLVGHEGKGSILSYLRQKSWAVSLVAGTYESGLEMNTMCSIFSIKVKLTESGMDNVVEVLTVIFQYLNMINQEGPKQYIFDEIQTVSNQTFCYQEQKEAEDYVYNLAQNMQHYRCEEYITGEKLYFEYNEKAIKYFMSFLNVNTVNIALMSHRFKKENFCEKERWTDCSYSSQVIPDEWTTRWQNLDSHPDLHLPEENKFIASDFELKHTKSDNKYPYKILENNQCCLWFKEDTKFKVPKAFAYFNFCIPSVVEDVLCNALMDCFVTILIQKLYDETYPASMANLNSYSEYTYDGFAVKLYGFNHKLHVLLETIMDCVQQFTVDQTMFDNIKRYLIHSYRNKPLKPSSLCQILELKIMNNHYFSPIDKLAVLPKVTLEMLNNFAQNHLSKVFVEGLVQGNITRGEALAMNQMILDKLNLQPPESIYPMQCLKLPLGNFCCQSVSLCLENKNASNAYIHQIGLKDIKNQSLTELYLVLMYEPCFDTLRTNELLGYSVYCTQRVWWNVVGYIIMVESQSSKFSSKFVEERIQAFSKKFLHETLDISDEKFQTQLESLLDCKKQEDLNLQEEVDGNWSKVYKHNYDFDKKQRQIKYLEQLQKEDFVQWLNEHTNSEANILSIRVLGPEDEFLKTDAAFKMNDEIDSNNPENLNVQLIAEPPSNDHSQHFITDIETFTSNLSYFPK